MITEVAHVQHESRCDCLLHVQRILLSIRRVIVHRSTNRGRRRDDRCYTPGGIVEGSARKARDRYIWKIVEDVRLIRISRGLVIRNTVPTAKRCLAVTKNVHREAEA